MKLFAKHSVSSRLVKAIRLLLANLSANEIKDILSNVFGEEYALFGHSLSNITLIDKYGNKLQCFDNFYLIKATGEHTCLGVNQFHKAYAVWEGPDECEDYLVHIKNEAEQHLKNKPTNIIGDRLIHALLAKLDAVASFHPELKKYIDHHHYNYPTSSKAVLNHVKPMMH